MAAKLYVVPASHPCAAVMAALDLKGVPYRRVDLLPVFHKAFQKARFGGAGTVPGIVFEDGTKVLGSRAIVRELERRRPEPPLLPPGDAERRRAEEAEEWGDQVLQPLVRRVLWEALQRDTGAQLSFLEGAKLFPPTPTALAKVSGGAVAFLERRINASTPQAVQADLRSLPGHLDRVDAWIEDATLGADRLHAGDLQVAASVRLLLTLEDLAPLFEGRAAADHARRVFPRYPGRVPAGALDASWLPAPVARG